MAGKIVAHYKLFKNDRFPLQMAIGTKVAPLVRKSLTEQVGEAKATA